MTVIVFDGTPDTVLFTVIVAVRSFTGSVYSVTLIRNEPLFEPLEGLTVHQDSLLE